MDIRLLGNGVLFDLNLPRGRIISHNIREKCLINVRRVELKISGGDKKRQNGERERILG